MTREEAIKILQGAIKKPNTKDGYLGQAIDMAIQALSQEPCESQVMDFPKTWEEYEQLYGFTDTDEIYTNGIRLIPSFRVKQWLEHQEQNLTHECGMANKELLEAARKFYAIHKDCVINDVPVKEYLEIGLQALSQEPCIDNVSEKEQKPCKYCDEDGFCLTQNLCISQRTICNKYYAEQEPCEDVISREDAIKAECEACDICGNMRYTKCQYFMQGCNEVKCLRDLPSVTQKLGKWIPVSERLPKDGQSVLFCDIDNDIMVGYHVQGRPNTHFSQDGTWEDMKNVKAWMPLPEPYHEV